THAATAPYSLSLHDALPISDPSILRPFASVRARTRPGRGDRRTAPPTRTTWSVSVWHDHRAPAQFAGLEFPVGVQAIVKTVAFDIGHDLTRSVHVDDFVELFDGSPVGIRQRRLVLRCAERQRNEYSSQHINVV